VRIKFISSAFLLPNLFSFGLTFTLIWENFLVFELTYMLIWEKIFFFELTYILIWEKIFFRAVFTLATLVQYTTT
jgi:hypothetical protein